MKAPVLRVVGRTRFELVTNGLKARYALSAQGAFPLCAGRLVGMNGQVLPAFCRNSPTYRAYNSATPTAAQLNAYVSECLEAVVRAAESAEAGDGSHDFNAGAETLRERIIAAIRSLAASGREG